MNVMNSSIKINQTNDSSLGKSKTEPQNDGTTDGAFNQILAMFNFIVQSPEVNGQPEAVSMTNGANIQESGLTIPNKADSNVLITNQPQESNQNTNNAVNTLFQNEEGSNQTTELNQNQLVQDLDLLLGEIQPQGNQKEFDESDNLIHKIQKMIDGIQAVDSQDVKLPPNGSLQEMDASKNDKKTDNDFVSKTSISLDKNELMKAIMPHVENRSNEGTSNSPAVFFEKVADQIKSDGVLLGVNHQLPNIGSKDMPAGISSQTAIPVTDFAPEVSEWIGRYIRVSAGESGSTAAKFSLYPEHLGHVEIKITTNQGHVSAQIVTDTPLAKEALEGQIQHLRQSLQQQGLIVQKLDVVQQTSETNVLNQANMSFSQSGSYSSREQQNSRSSQDVSKKRQDTGQKEVENESLAISYGGAVKNSASRIDFTA